VKFHRRLLYMKILTFIFRISCGRIRTKPEEG